MTYKDAIEHAIAWNAAHTQLLKRYELRGGGDQAAADILLSVAEGYKVLADALKREGA